MKLGEDSFKVISDWHYYAILELTYCDSFIGSVAWISSVLDLPHSKTLDAIERLKRLNYLEITTEGIWIDRLGDTNNLDNEFKAVAFTEHQRQILKKAVEALENVPYEDRVQSSMTVAVSKEKIPEAKRMILNFIEELNNFLKSGPTKEEVYNISVSLYPVTNTKGKKTMKIQSLLVGLLVTTSLFASKGGGGGDPEEIRVDEIRSDLVKWIEKGGARGLKLPYEISLNQYENGMLEFLAPKKVSVIFVDQDHATNEELQVLVNGKPKTCRSYFSGSHQPYILCHRARFQATPEAYQYRPIHHEHAGLAYLERNDGDSSDYVISNQITKFLIPEVVLRLGVKDITDELPNVDTSAFIVNPNIGGVPFSSGSDQNGVCRALGYKSIV